MSSMTMRPDVARSSPATSRSSVDLPQPEGPSSTVRLPLGTSNDTSSSARTSPQCFERCSMRMGFTRARSRSGAQRRIARQYVDQCRVHTGRADDDVAAIDERVAAAERADGAPRFLHQQAAGADVPGVEPFFPVSVGEACGNEREVERRGAGPANAGTTLHDLAQRCEIVVEIVPVLERQARTQHGLGEVRAAGDMNAHAIQKRAAAARGGEEPAAGGIEHDADGDGVIDLQRDRHTIVRKPMQEIRRAVQRIDQPREGGTAGVARFLGLERMPGKARGQRPDDHAFGAAVDFADEVVDVFALDGEVRAVGGTFAMTAPAARAASTAVARNACRSSAVTLWRSSMSNEWLQSVEGERPVEDADIERVREQPASRPSVQL